ncbi:MAG: hypothetical protein K2F70_05350 [Muribaculaceae bacterium]|nr:hypothetical protein [Muribaculaceae bacterium]
MKKLRIILASALIGLTPLIVAAVLYFIFGSEGKIYDGNAGTIFGVDMVGMAIMGAVSFFIALPAFIWAVNRRERNQG